MQIRRLIAGFILSLFILLVATPASSSPSTGHQHQVVERRAAAAPTYPYDAPEVRRWWNGSHVAKIDGPQATYFAAYLNAVVEQRIAQYLLAVYLNAVAAQAIPNEARWDRVAACESGGNWAINTGNGYYGGLQFLPSTWRAVGGTGLPHQHSKAEQIRRAEILKARAGLGQWPVCGRRW